jgi:MFS family permease
VFVVSFGVALIGLTVLGRLVEPPAVGSDVLASRPPVVLRSTIGLLGTPGFRVLLLLGILLSLFTVSDAFVYLAFQRRSDISPGVFPLLYVGTALTAVLLAVPAGRLADRVGRRRVFLWGHGLLLGVYGLLLLPSPGPLALAGCLLLLGAYYAATDGVLMALASTMVPPHLLTSGLAVLTTGVTLARLLMSVLFGALWTWGGPEWAVRLFMIGLAAALAVAATVLARAPEEKTHETA